MKNKITFLHGLGNRKEYKNLFPYFNVPQIDWINGDLNKLKLGRPNILVAHSLGCMVACMHAEKYKIDKLVLCSPIPQETLENLKVNKIQFIIGANESWILNEVNRVTSTLKCEWSITLVPKTNHRITKRYLKSILELI